ncbi:hypothetical protein SAMN04488020_103282 [Palleronia marisminoris]|uniref:Uncharacterized protein n=1 Tax=Palleronia marisminoris TaxID=315423 RepID=A0A1Y5SFH4_9RHOB|nr:hypothetical protein [Palleronia marisminoris]SFG71858.1 hypothetical protein SAMN04488020_103282 [Palleronia marisminoris]SLN36764.1 hypothetical protein PAM7066_01564 [Palleronia marisminoris]
MRLTLLTLLLGASATAGAAQVRDGTGNVYPTVAVADYVLGCMAANGNTPEALRNCSCSIDVISTILPYEAYEEAEAFMSLGRVTGERGVLFRESEQSKEATDALRRAQIEAELRCF